MEFAAWLEGYFGNKWHTFAPPNNKRLIGRVRMALGDTIAKAWRQSFRFEAEALDSYA